MKRLLPVLTLLLALVVFLTSCRTHRSATSGGEQYVTSRLSLTLTSDGHKTNVGGTLKMKRDDVIQLSLVALGIMEAARIELTRDHILVIDRMGRRYLKEKYADIPSLAQAGINFQTFQSLFWGDLKPSRTTKGKASLSWEYQERTPFAGRDFPTRLHLQLSGNAFPLDATVQLSRLANAQDWERRTEVSKSRYTRVTVDELSAIIAALVH